MHRVIAYTYDALNRVQVISDVAPPGILATYQYIGPSRVGKRDNNGNNTRSTWGYDALGRVQSTLHAVIAGATIDQRNYAWDAMSNKLSMDKLAVPPIEHRGYTYDAANRLIAEQIIAGGPPTNINYTLDGDGNRQSVVGGPDAGPYPMSPALCEPGDFQMNQYTSTPFDNRSYDKKGNLVGTFSSPRTFKYDYKNRLVQFTDAGTATTTTYRYDAIGRRVAKTVGTTFTRFLYAGRMEIAELNSTGTFTNTNVINVSAAELNFQTDGPIICQALFQRLAQGRRNTAQINYAGDRLEVYFDPAYTVTQGGIIFGTSSASPGMTGTIVIPPQNNGEDMIESAQQPEVFLSRG